MDDDEGAPASHTGLDYRAAELRAEAQSVDAMVHALVERLSGIPGLVMNVAYRHARWRRLVGDVPFVNDLHRRADPIRNVAVTVGAIEYWLRVTGGAIRCGTDTVVAGSGRTTQEVPFSRWAQALFESLTQETRAHRDALTALRELIEQNRF
ncbi:MAG: hypothetical protein M0Z95_06415 [Actinomycetota bacterium]|nr:hypothetical protein [Actinomycetota bacterium]